MISLNTSSQVLLRMNNITKEFPGVKALDNVDLDVRKGEVLALMGENGAGKSTLMKILSGMYVHGTFSGEIFIEDKLVKLHKPKDAELVGVSTIYQELELFDELSVAENLVIGKYPSTKGFVDWNEIYFNAQRILKEIGVSVDLDAKVKHIGIGQQQLVEIAKALLSETKILILDEPTAALTEVEVNLLMGILKDLRAKGISSIFIAHKLNEIFEIADRVMVLRDGKSLGIYDIKDVNENDVIKLMVGRELNQRFPKKTAAIGEQILEIKHFTKYESLQKNRPLIRDISFHIRTGEILGISGLIGSGRTELIMSLFGYLKGTQEGEVIINGNTVEINNPQKAINLGMGLVSEDRKRYGLLINQSIVMNSTLASLKRISDYGILNLNKEVSLANQYVENTNTKLSSIEDEVNTLSGGNQQKVLLSRTLMTNPKILFLDEPTRGIDVGAKYEIYTLINKLAAEGAAILLISSEMPEIIGMCDRVMVMFNGTKSGELQGENITQENIMYYASGGAQ